MKEIKAHLNYLRIAPRKVRLVSDLVKGKSVAEVQSILKNTKKRSAHSLYKLLNSAVANAKHNFQVEKENLFIKNVLINKGPTLKRSFPRSRGMANPINKRSSHITIILGTI